MRRVTGTSQGFARGALAPRASSLARRGRCILCGTDQWREYRRFKGWPGFRFITAHALAVEILDRLAFPPELAMAISDIEDAIAEAGQVPLGKREFALGVFALEKIEAVNAAGDA